MKRCLPEPPRVVALLPESSAGAEFQEASLRIFTLRPLQDAEADVGVHIVDRVGVDLADLWGSELYCNADTTPWFHLTADLQYVQNENADDDPGLILGLRGVLEF